MESSHYLCFRVSLVLIKSVQSVILVFSNMHTNEGYLKNTLVIGVWIDW